MTFCVIRALEEKMQATVLYQCLQPRFLIPLTKRQVVELQITKSYSQTSLKRAFFNPNGKQSQVITPLEVSFTVFRNALREYLRWRALEQRRRLLKGG
jgi:hypothetical protein